MFLQTRTSVMVAFVIILLTYMVVVVTAAAAKGDTAEEDPHEAAIRKAAGIDGSDASESLPIGSGENEVDSASPEEVAFDQYYDEDPRNRRLHERLRSSRSIEMAVEDEIESLSSAVNGKRDESVADYTNPIVVDRSRGSHLTDIVNKYNFCTEEKGRVEQERGSLQQDLARCQSELSLLRPDEMACRQSLHKLTSHHDTCRQDLESSNLKIGHLEIRNRQCVSQLDQRIRDTHSVEKELTSKSAGDSASMQEVTRLHGAVEVLSRELTEAKVEIDRLETDKHELIKSMSRLQAELQALRDPSAEANTHHKHPGHAPSHHAAHQRRRFKDIANKAEERYAHLDATLSKSLNADADVDDETHNQRRVADEKAVNELREQGKRRAKEELDARERQHNHKQY